MLRENSPGVRVLIVDDEMLIRWSLAQTLGDAGAVVVEASDVQSAMAALRDHPRGFHVAVLDVDLPDGDGLGLLASIRRQWPSMRVLLMTAFGTPELTQSARALGALGIVDKPFELDAMTELVLGGGTGGVTRAL